VGEGHQCGSSHEQWPPFRVVNWDGAPGADDTVHAVEDVAGVRNATLTG
jgi:hypothetical protein